MELCLCIYLLQINSIVWIIELLQSLFEKIVSFYNTMLEKYKEYLRVFPRHMAKRSGVYTRPSTLYLTGILFEYVKLPLFGVSFVQKQGNKRCGI